MITVLGASGFVGSHLVKELEKRGFSFYAPSRNEDLSGKELGDIIYCVGLTGDFRSRPYDTIEAHVTKLSQVLSGCRFDSLTYLSSTRIYIHNEGMAKEESPIVIQPSDPFDLFNASKLAGELLALNCGKKNVRVARLSNVFGDDFTSENFLTTIIKDAIHKNRIVLRTTPDSAKDYIHIQDVCSLLISIALEGKSTIYNVASGVNVTNEDILCRIKESTGCAIEYDPKAERIIFPPIAVEKLKAEFGFKPEATVLRHLGTMVDNFRSFPKQ